MCVIFNHIVRLYSVHSSYRPPTLGLSHPYAALRQIPDAQKLFERAARGDSSVSSDGEHIRPEMLQAAFGAVAGELAVNDLLLTDSATAGVPFKGEWDEGATFMRASKCAANRTRDLLTAPKWHANDNMTVDFHNSKKTYVVMI